MCAEADFTVAIKAGMGFILHEAFWDKKLPKAGQSGFLGRFGI